MTVEANDTVDRYTISGTGPYVFSFRIFDEDDLLVQVDGGNEDTIDLAINTHYTVSGVDDQDGGTVTLTAAAASLYAGDTIDIRSNTAEYQPTSIRNQGAFLPEIHEDAFDRLARQIQDLSRKVSGSVRYPDDEATDAAAPKVASRKGRYLFANAVTGIFEWVTSIATTALSQSIFNQYQADSDPYKRTAAEIAAGVTPTNYAYLPGDVRRYGAVSGGSGATNRTAIQAALSIGIPVFGGEGQTYAISSGLTVPAAGVLTIRDLKLRPDGAFTALIPNVTTNATTTLAADQRMGKLTIVVTSAAGMAVGNILTLISTAAWPYDIAAEGLKRGETNRIIGIAGTTLTLATPTVCDYDVSAETVTVKAYAAKEIDIDGLDIEYSPSQGAISLGLDACTGTVKARVKGSLATGISLVNCFGLQIHDSLVLDCYVSGTGYGVQINSSTMCSVTSSFLYNNRRGVDISGGHPSHLCMVDSCTVVGNSAEGSCVGGHGTAVRSSFTNNLLCNAPVGVQLRGPSTHVEGNQFYGVGSFCILNTAPGLVLRNNTQFLMPITYDTDVGPTDALNGYFFEISGSAALLFSVPSEEIVVEANRCSTLAAFMYIGTSVTPVSRLKVNNNDVILHSTGGAVNFIDAETNPTTLDSSCQVVGNRIRSASGALTPFLDLTLSCRIRDNVGYVTENGGVTSAIATGATVTHGCAATPTIVTVTALDSGPTDVYVSAIGATTFVINYGGGGTHVFAWEAKTVHHYQ